MRDDLGNRMKEFYENIPKTKLMRRTPVIIRIDGRAFHSFTRGFRKPFDTVLMSNMQKTMKYLCEGIQGAVLGYTQSDEISILLVDYKKLNSDAWFDNDVQKICSISASMATLAFNTFFRKEVKELIVNDKFYKDEEEYYNTLLTASEKGAMFDSRCFNIPKEEVTNYFLWRQLDAIRNSIQMVGQANFSHKQLQNKSCGNIQEMLLEKGINWEDFSTDCKRGTCCYKEETIVDGQLRTSWKIDKDIPIFKGGDRDYIEKWLESEEE